MRQCRICGCTDEVPCMVYDQALGFERPCYWVEVNLCSACAGVEDAELIEELLDREQCRRQ